MDIGRDCGAVEHDIMFFRYAYAAFRYYLYGIFKAPYFCTHKNILVIEMAGFVLYYGLLWYASVAPHQHKLCISYLFVLVIYYDLILLLHSE